MTRRLTDRLASLGVYALAGFGVLSLLTLGLGFWLNMGLVMFRTGSMEPSIPTGSVALVQEVSPEQISDADVLTVQTEGMEISVTHRVIAVNEAEDIRWAEEHASLSRTDVQDGEATVIRMRGDANQVQDREPYVIREGQAQVVLGHVPALAHAVQGLAQREVQIPFAAAMAVAIAWAFWPRQEVEGEDDSNEQKQEAEYAPRHSLL